jgi:hypothetical protein
MPATGSAAPNQRGVVRAVSVSTGAFQTRPSAYPENKKPRALSTRAGRIPPTPSREECAAWHGPTGRTGLKRPGRFPDSRRARKPFTAFPPASLAIRTEGSGAFRVPKNRKDVQGPPRAKRCGARRSQWRDRGRFSRPSHLCVARGDTYLGCLLPRLSLCTEISFVKACSTVNNSG